MASFSKTSGFVLIAEHEANLVSWLDLVIGGNLKSSILRGSQITPWLNLSSNLTN